MAEGVEWSDGAVALRWRGRWPATTAWEGGIDAVLAVHGQGGAAFVRWLTVPLPAPPTGSDTDAAEPPVAAAVRVPTAGPDGLCSRCGRVWPCLTCGP